MQGDECEAVASADFGRQRRVIRDELLAGDDDIIVDANGETVLFAAPCGTDNSTVLYADGAQDGIIALVNAMDELLEDIERTRGNAPSSAAS